MLENLVAGLCAAAILGSLALATLGFIAASPFLLLDALVLFALGMLGIITKCAKETK